MPKTMADPQERNNQKDAKTYQEHTRNHDKCEDVESLALFTCDSLVDTSISKFNQIINGDDRYAHITYRACNSTVFLMLGLGFVFPTEHFSHFKVPVSEQEVTIVVKHNT